MIPSHLKVGKGEWKDQKGLARMHFSVITWLIPSEAGTLVKMVLQMFPCARSAVTRTVTRPGTLLGGMRNEIVDMMANSPALKK